MPGLIDANVILRYLTNDPPEMAALAAALFDQIVDGRETGVIEDVVVAEVVWTLRSFYRTARADIARLLIEIIAEENIRNTDKPTLTAALTLYKEYNLGFADALLAARSLSHDDLDVVSFDRGLDRVPGVRRREPV